MTAVSSVKVGMRDIKIYRFTGDVVDSQRSSETQVVGQSNGQISSRTVHYNEIFLKAQNGEERSVEVAAAGVPIRAGNTVTVLWGINGNNKTGSYTTVLNHNTKDIGHIAKAVNDLSGPHLYNLLIVAFVFVGVFSAMGVLGGKMGALVPLVATGAFFYWLIRRRKTLKNAMEAAVADLR